MKVHLRACPYCKGKQPYVDTWYGGSSPLYQVRCKTCGAAASMKGTKKAAAASWNKFDCTSEPKNKMRYSKWIVLLCIALAVYGFERILHVAGVSGVEPAVTAGAFFGFIATELWGLSKIKREENKQEQKEEQEDAE